MLESCLDKFMNKNRNPLNSGPQQPLVFVQVEHRCYMRRVALLGKRKKKAPEIKYLLISVQLNRFKMLCKPEKKTIKDRDDRC